MWEVMTTCVIMHNIIVKDERENAAHLGEWDYQGPLVQPEHVPKILKPTCKLTVIFVINKFITNSKPI
jgi:hypothetical protein